MKLTNFVSTWNTPLKRVWFSVFLGISFATAGDHQDAPTRQADQRGLTPLRDFVGEWRGVGQVRRGSTQGAWIERSSWSWKFTPQRAALRFTSKQSRVFQRGELRSGAKPGLFTLDATASGSELTTRYQGGFDKQHRLVMTTKAAAKNMPSRVTLRLVAKANRLVVFYERQTSSGRFLRMSEVGYTRRGSDFGKRANFVECIVSGGKGTIPVVFEGKKYYVCCGGCRDYFRDNPEEVLREYHQRKAKKK